MNRLSIVLLTLIFLFFSFGAKAQTPSLTDDWPQVQHDPQHTGYSPETLGTNFRVTWTYPFQPDRVYPQTQAIIYQGKVFVGTEGANGKAPRMIALYAGSKAQDLRAGTLAWEFAADGPILNSAAADNGIVYFATLAGSVYALNNDTGAQIWQVQPSAEGLGFSVAPVIGDNKILIGGRDGYFYALNPNDGTAIWKYNIGSPILQTGAFDNGRVFFGTMDMYIYALNTSPTNVNNPNTILFWKSSKIPGMAFKDYWPVVTQGRVIVRPFGGREWELASVDYSDAAQTTALASYDANPANYRLSMIILDEATGQQMPAVIHWASPTMNATAPPVCVDKDGNIIVQAPRERSWQAGWARASLTTRKIIQPLNDGTTYNNGSYASGYGNVDENMNVSCSNNLILAFHTQEYNAQYTGAFNLTTNSWTRINPGWTNQEMTTNTQGGGGNPASISNGMIYHISFYELIARTTN